MAGIFPAAGTAAANTSNAASPVNTAPGCDPLYYRVGCVPVFDPAAGNAVISEIVNAVNTLKPYDCTRLDNLASVLATISDLCKLPTIQEVGIAEPDLDDSLAGCFDGETARVTISALAQLINSQKSICGLPDIGALDDDDYVAVCAGPNQTYSDAKIRFSVLKQLLGGGGASALIPGDQFYNAYATSGGHNVPVPTTGRDAMIAEMYYEPAGGGVVGDGTIDVATGGGQFQSVLLQSNWPMQVDPASQLAYLARPARLFANMVRKNNQWFMLCNMQAIPIGADDGTIRFRGGRYATLTIREASRF